MSADSEWRGIFEFVLTDEEQEARRLEDLNTGYAMGLAAMAAITGMFEALRERYGLDDYSEGYNDGYDDGETAGWQEAVGDD